MLDAMGTATVALATLFATVGPIDVAGMFAVLTGVSSYAEKRAIAVKGVLIATAILLVFALAGELILDGLGISIAAMKTAGGVLLMLIGIEMVFARTSGATSTTDEEAREAERKRDIAVFPIATPLIAGPGAMSVSVLLMANAGEDILKQLIVLASILTMMLVTLICMLAAGQIVRLLGVTGMHVINRVFGILLTALAVQFIFEGVKLSGLIMQ
ncbi:MAG: MarC family protein [Gammaproteobacteria bacterium]